METKRKAGSKQWQSRGRCTSCLAKVAGCRRVRRCPCGGPVENW